MTTKKNFCNGGGRLVGGRQEVPEDASVFVGEGDPSRAGCSALFCEPCEQNVVTATAARRYARASLDWPAAASVEAALEPPS